MTTGTIFDYEGYQADKPKEWRKATHDEGVAFFAPWEDPFGGFPEHSRRLARSINNSGYHVHLKSIDPAVQLETSFSTPGKEKFEICERYNDLLNNSISRTLVEIYHIVPTVEFLFKLTVHRFISPRELETINKYRIVSTVWERSNIERPIIDSLNKMGQIWVANHHDMGMLLNEGVTKPVFVIPIPFFDNDPLLKLRNRKRLSGVTRFYHIGKWEPRKAQHEMVGAFLLAFSPGECKLYLKTSKTAPDFGEFPNSPEDSVHRWLKDDRVSRKWTIATINQDLFVIKERISKEQIFKLHQLGDIYVSTSKGEGFDMPAFDAKLAGNTLLYTPSGGPQDFACGTDIIIEPDGLEECHPFYRWKGGNYLKLDINKIVTGMKMAKDEFDKKRILPALSTFRMESVGRQAALAVSKLLGREDGFQSTE